MKNSLTILISVALSLTIVASASGKPAVIFDSPRTFSIMCVSAVIFVAGGLFMFLRRESVRIYKSDIICILFLFVYLVDYKQLDSLWDLGVCALLMLFVMFRYCRKIYYKIIFVSCLCTACLLAVWGYMQYFEIVPSHNKYFLLTGPYYNPSVLAIMLALLIGIILNVAIVYKCLVRKQYFCSTGIVAIVVFCLPVLVLSFSRAAYVALLTSILYALYLKYGVRTKRKHILYFLGGILFVLFFAGASCVMKPQSANGRLLIWKVGLRMIADKPLSGFGRGGFAANYLYYQADYMKISASPEERVLAGNTHLAFNEPLRITVEYGLIGLMVYLAFIIWILFPYNGENKVAIISKSLLAGVAIWGMFDNPDQAFPVLTLWVMGVACSLKKENTTDELCILKKNTYKGVAAVFVCCFVLFGGMMVSKWKSYHGLQLYLNTNSVRDISECAAVLPRFKEDLKDNILFAYFYCRTMKLDHNDIEFLNYLDILQSKFPSTSLLLMKGDYWRDKGCWTDAEEAYRLAADMVPSLQMPRGRLAVLYKKMGRRQEAVALVREILTEKVKVYGFDTFTLHRELKRIFEDELK